MCNTYLIDEQTLIYLHVRKNCLKMTTKGRATRVINIDVVGMAVIYNTFIAILF